MQNYPEASSPSLRCTSWEYKSDTYKFRDVEENKTHKLSMPELLKGLQIMMDLMVAGKLKGISHYVMPNFQDPGYWDSDAADALVQCAIFGEVIYG
jgi:hypothetical protein